MPGMNSGVNVSNPTVVAAFKAALLHQGLIALLIFAVLGVMWLGVRALLPGATRGAGAQAAAETAWAQPEPAWRQVLRIGFGLLWVFDGILQGSAEDGDVEACPARSSSPRRRHLHGGSSTS